MDASNNVTPSDNKNIGQSERSDYTESTIKVVTGTSTYNIIGEDGVNKELRSTDINAT